VRPYGKTTHDFIDLFSGAPGHPGLQGDGPRMDPGAQGKPARNYTLPDAVMVPVTGVLQTTKLALQS